MVGESLWYKRNLFIAAFLITEKDRPVTSAEMDLEALRFLSDVKAVDNKKS